MFHLLGQPPAALLAATVFSPEGELGHESQLQPTRVPLMLNSPRDLRLTENPREDLGLPAALDPRLYPGLLPFLPLEREPVLEARELDGNCALNWIVSKCTAQPLELAFASKETDWFRDDGESDLPLSGGVLSGGLPVNRIFPRPLSFLSTLPNELHFLCHCFSSFTVSGTPCLSLITRC
jgi:hypothetical protein